MTDLEEVNLIQSYLAARGGCPTPEEVVVWARFFHDVDPLIRLAVTKFRGCRNEVEDVNQDVWIALLLGLPKLHFDPARGTLRGWVTGVARNVASIHARSLSRYHDEALTAQLSANFPDPEAGPGIESEQYQRDQRRERLRAIIADLGTRIPELSQAIIVLRWIEGRTVPVIARELGVSENCVKMRLRRARRQLRDLLHRAGLGSVEASG